MPQLDISTFIPQLFWLGISFLFLYGMLSRKILPQIARIFERRREAIQEKINQAGVYRDEAEALLAHYEKALATAREEAHQKSTSVQQEFSADIDLRKQQYLDTLAARHHEEEEKLYQARQDIQAKLQGMAQDVAQTILEKLTNSLKGEQK